jgi:hypothetical protein
LEALLLGGPIAASLARTARRPRFRSDRRRSTGILGQMTPFVTAGAGFLLAVLWFDLMFDVQALFHRGRELPEDTLASIAGYYRRVTTTARPMNRLVAAVMLATVGAIVVQIVRGIGRNGWGGYRSSWLAWRSSSRHSVGCPPRCGSAVGLTRVDSKANLRNRSAAITSYAPPPSSPLSQSSCRSPEDPSAAHALREQHGRPRECGWAWKAAAGLALQGAVDAQ